MAMRDTVKAVFEGTVKDNWMQDKPKNVPEFVKDFEFMFWSYQIVKVSKSGEETLYELMTDFDCLTINVKMYMFGKDP